MAVDLAQVWACLKRGLDEGVARKDRLPEGLRKSRRRLCNRLVCEALAGCKAVIEQQLGGPAVPHFAYRAEKESLPDQPQEDVAGRAEDAPPALKRKLRSWLLDFAFTRYARAQVLGTVA